MNKKTERQFYQQGYLLISALILVVVVGFVVVTVARITSAESGATASKAYSAEGFYVAEGGLQAAGYLLFAPGFSNRILCANLTANLTDQSLGDGLFTVTGTLDRADPVTTLDSGITASDTTIPVASVANYASSGVIMIDREMMAYTSTATSGCGVAPACFENATRGLGGTTAVAHSANVRVAQNQCSLESAGGIPDLSSPKGKRIVSQVAPLEEGWIVGKETDSGTRLLQWNGIEWQDKTVTYSSAMPNKDLKSISVISSADAWVVGKKDGSSSNLDYWDGSVWTQDAAGSVPSVDLESVDCVSSDDCWAVGKKNGGQETFLHWDGSSWTRNTSIVSGQDKDMQSVSCVASNDCWAVGSKGSAAHLMHWGNSNWTQGSADATVPVKNYLGVSCVKDGNDTKCWAVGEKDGASNFIHYDGTIWSRETSITSDPRKDLTSVSCVADDDCWAVGKKGSSANIMHWDGANWSLGTLAGSVERKDLNEVKCRRSDDCWAVGKSGSIDHYNGTEWIGVTSPVGDELQSVDFIPKASPPLMQWKELFV